MRIAVVGASGVVGREMLKLLIKYNYKNISAFASEKSDKKEMEIANKKFIIEKADIDKLNSFDFILWATDSSVSKAFIPHINAVNIDNSSAFRMAPDVPLVVPEINGHILKKNEKIIANPNCSTAIMLMGILPFIKEDIIETLFVSTYQSVSGAGYKGVIALEKESQKERYEDSPFSANIRNNIIPFIGNENDLPWSGEEMKMIEETRKITNKNFTVIPTCVRVPVKRSHSESVSLILNKSFSYEEIKELYKNEKGVRIEDIPASPEDLAEKEYVSVSRIRIHPQYKNIVSLWITGDNLWKGAALNAVQILNHINKYFNKH